jgi:thiamine biosynthesis lipoprotein
MLPLLLALLIGAPAPTASAPAAPLRLSARAFGKAMEIEVRGLPPESARGAIEKAFAEVAELERLTTAGLAALNAQAGKGPQPVDARLLAVLTRAWSFCEWSEGAQGPLGRDLYTLWGLRSPVEELPSPEQAQQAAGLAACDRLTLDPRTAALAAGSGLDLLGFVEGAAVDRAVEVLRQQRVDNGFVRIGPVDRGFGPGPQGKGWPVAMPQIPGLEEHADQLYLRDRALAVASQADHPLQGGGVSYLNQRTGRPTPGVLTTLAVTELALDAQGLATAMLVLGPREGQLRIGTLRPRPALLWYLGTGTGAPLAVDYRWSDVVRTGQSAPGGIGRP